jgi:hypothetical protein
MRVRFKLRSLVLLIAFLALTLAVAVVSIENRRLQRELQAQRQIQSGAVALSLDLAFPLSYPHSPPTAVDTRMPDSVDAFARSTEATAQEARP